MKKRFLRFRMMAKIVMIGLLLGVMGITKGYCIRFSAVCPSGISLYYNITDDVNHYVELTYPNHHEDEGYWEDYELWGNEAIVIPETVEYNGTTYTVTGIGDQSFAGCSNFDNFTLPNTIESIGVSAFEPLNGMHITDFTLPANLKYIADNAFEMWVGLQRLTVLGKEPPAVGNNAIGMYWDPYMGPKPILLVPGGCRDRKSVV